MYPSEHTHTHCHICLDNKGDLFASNVNFSLSSPDLDWRWKLAATVGHPLHCMPAPWPNHATLGSQWFDTLNTSPHTHNLTLSTFYWIATISAIDFVAFSSTNVTVYFCCSRYCGCLEICREGLLFFILHPDQCYICNAFNILSKYVKKTPHFQF